MDETLRKRRVLRRLLCKRSYIGPWTTVTLSLAVEAINQTNFYAPKVYLPRLLSNYSKVSVVGPLPNTFLLVFLFIITFYIFWQSLVSVVFLSVADNYQTKLH